MAVRTILVVDDAAADRLNLETILTQAGYLVRTAVSGKSALESLKGEKPDMIFMDVVMAEMDGFETCRTITKDPATKHVPVIFCTSKNQKADRVWATMNGGKGLVAKPYTADQILEQVRML
jgi:twitching motility two-component system response regulator PilH